MPYEIVRQGTLCVTQVRISLSTIRTRAILVVTGWTIIALLFSSFGYSAALRRGSEQAWWPSLGYALAIFSIWALMTAPIIWFVGRVERRHYALWRRLMIYALGLPIVCTFHVFGFAALYWPLYNDDGRISTRWLMGERMLLGNLDTNALLFTALVGVTVHLSSKRRADQLAETEHLPAAPPQDALVIRARGGFLKIPLNDVDWIEASGDYCQIHADQSVHLIDETLASLAGRLPINQFSRVHRSTIIALNRVVICSCSATGSKEL